MYSLKFNITNFKSYFGTPVQLDIAKPITIIAGPNGEGKTNLLEAMLIGVDNFISRSRNFKRESLFTKEVKISSNPEIFTNIHDLIFTDLIKKGLTGRSPEISYPERFDPVNIISHKKKDGEVSMRISKHSRRGEIKLAEIATSIINQPRPFQSKGYINKLECLELLYLNSDMALTNLFVKLVGQEFSDQLKNIRGPEKRAAYQRKILEMFLKEEDRLICEIDNGEFEEKYLKDTEFFLTNNLATSAKKECMLYILGILAEKHKEKKDWLTIFFIDEIEEGLHMDRQRKIAEALIDTLKENEDLRRHIKIVMTTHSPIMYSELVKYPEYVDLYFALRNPKETSKIFHSDDIVNYELIEKRILTELGLSIYEMPKKLLFVEGVTDKIFWEEILQDIKIFTLGGPTIPNKVAEFITSIPLARTKEYFVVVDRNAYNQVKKDTERIKEKNVNIKESHIGSNSLEEFILGVNINSRNFQNVWTKIGDRLEEFNKKLDEREKVMADMNKIVKAKTYYEKKGQEGLKEFIESLKKRDNFYKVIGSRRTLLLKKENIAKIAEIKKIIEG